MKRMLHPFRHLTSLWLSLHLHRFIRWSLLFTYSVILYSPNHQLYAQPTVEAQRIDPINIRRFSPTMDAQGLGVTERAVGLKTGDFNLGLMVDFAFDPLRQKINGQNQTIVERYTTGQIYAAFGLWNHLTLGMSQPFVILQGDVDGTGTAVPFAEDGLSDTRFSAKGVILNSQKSMIGVAIQLDTEFVFSQTHPLSSHGATGASPLLTPWLILDAEWHYVVTSLNVGYALKQERSLSDPVTLEDGSVYTRDEPIQLGPELSYRWGISGRYIPNFLHHSVEIIGAVPMGQAQRGSTLELISTLRFIFS